MLTLTKDFIRDRVADSRTISSRGENCPGNAAIPGT
jgi:hypothetical protein